MILRELRLRLLAVAPALLTLLVLGGPVAAEAPANVVEGQGPATAQPAAPPQGAEFHWLRTSDSWQLASWYWPPKAAKVKGAKAPGVLLLHMRGKDKGSWGGLPAVLHDEGFAVLAIDLRGHGETLAPGGRRAALEALQDADYQNMLFDVGAAHEFIASQGGVDPERLGIIGASIGANLALIYCAGDLRVRTAVCLSPGLDYRGLQPQGFMARVGKRPVYLIASQNDAQAAEACRALAAAGAEAGPRSLRLFEGQAHGTDLLAVHPGLSQTIDGGWLLNYLPPVR